MPKSALYFLTNFCNLFGKVEPQFLLILNAFGLSPIIINFAPNCFKSLGADLYPAPLAQSKTILIFLNLKFEGIFFLNFI